MKDLKYLFAYTVPLSVFISFESNGIGTYSAVLYAFIVLPIFDLIFGEDSSNLNKEDALTKKNKWLFDLMLYLNLPLVFGLLFHLFSKFEQNEIKKLIQDEIEFVNSNCKNSFNDYSIDEDLIWIDGVSSDHVDFICGSLYDLSQKFHN